jgi:ribokinase
MNNISVLGIFVADLVFFGKDIPSKGQSILGDDFKIGPGGKGSNQAITVAKLGGNIDFITKIGKDSYGEMALNLYKENNVKTDSVLIDNNNPTGVAGIMVDQYGNNAINIVPGASGKITDQDIHSNLETIKNSKVFLTQLEIPHDVTINALKLAKENNCITILNPAPAREIAKSDFKLIDYFTPNETEAEYYLNQKLDNDEDIKDAASKFLDKGVKNIIITLGEKGSYFANNEQNFFIKSHNLKEKVIDTTGAGDVFNGALAFSLANDTNIKDAILFANKVAGISTTRLGAANSVPSLNEVVSY